MLNTPDVYLDCGRRAARAANRRDQSAVEFEKNWFHRAWLLERDEDRRAARRAFDDGYREVRAVPTPCYY